MALDAKLGFDDNALFKRHRIGDMRDYDEEDPSEIMEAVDAGIKLVCCITEGIPVLDIVKVKRTPKRSS